LSRYFSPSAPSRYPEQFGFRSEAQSVHGSRTIMLADLSALLGGLPPSATHADYEHVIREENLLGKPTDSTRLWAWKKLRELYALDPEVPVFRIFRRLWKVESEDGRPLLTLVAALARDALLRASVGAVLERGVGDPVTKDHFREAIVAVRGDRFSKSTMDAILSHLVSSWTESGHLSGRREKVRTRPVPTPASTTLALALGYLTGARGTLLFSTLWADALDAPEALLHDHAREASRRGWLVYRGVGSIIEIDFPELLTPEERALPHE
jgi:hypothetical protein